MLRCLGACRCTTTPPPRQWMAPHNGRCGTSGAHRQRINVCRLIWRLCQQRMEVHGQALHVSLLSILLITVCRSLLEELLAIARATRGKEPTVIDLSPVGEEFDPIISM
jgi:hypothetical protein